MKFQNMTEVDAYFSTEKIRCLACGKWFAALSNHIGRAHGMTATTYKEAFGIPAYRHGLVGQNVRRRQQESMQQRWLDYEAMRESSIDKAIAAHRARDGFGTLRGRKGRMSPAIVAKLAAGITNRPNAPRKVAKERATVACNDCGAAYVISAMAAITRARPFRCEGCQREKRRAYDRKRNATEARRDYCRRRRAMATARV